MAVVGGAVAGLAAKEVVDRHRSGVARHLTGDLDEAPAWPEPNRSGQPLPLPVILDRQRQRRARREWQDQRRQQDSPGGPRMARPGDDE